MSSRFGEHAHVRVTRTKPVGSPVLHLGEVFALLSDGFIGRVCWGSTEHI